MNANQNFLRHVRGRGSRRERGPCSWLLRRGAILLYTSRGCASQEFSEQDLFSPAERRRR